MVAITLNTLLNFNDEIINFFQTFSKIFLLFGLFCIGSQFNAYEIQLIDGKPLLMALILWAAVIPSAYVLIKYF